ncbi:MAG: hypothetical protein LLF89_10425 [Spirochaetaceae bacterium]|nr:hypothetical protein [Spirochaetaceae bacterium]
MTQGYLLGIDVGGSRTRALVADNEGRALGFGEAGAGNHEIVGYDGLFGAMREALCQALADTNVGESMRFVGAGFGIAGFDWESERAQTMSAIARLELSCPVALRNDAALGLAAGSSEGWGINISAGTSNNCYGRTRSGHGGDGSVVREGRIAGAGAAFGENGGAAEIVKAALVCINHARIMRGPPTALTGAFCSRTGASDANALVEGLVCGRVAPSADWAQDVFATARAGDAVARGVITWAGRELGESAVAVARQLGLEQESFEVVLSGSLFAYEPKLEAGVAAVLAEAAPGARLVHFDAPPVIGAVVLGAEEASLDGRAVRTRLLETVAEVIRPRQ